MAGEKGDAMFGVEGVVEVLDDDAAAAAAILAAIVAKSNLNFPVRVSKR